MPNPIIFPDSVAGNPCLLTQVAIEQSFGLDPSAIWHRYGMLNALVSDANRTAQGFSVLPNRDKPSAANKQITVRYTPYICETSDISSIDKCNLGEGATPTYLSANYIVDDIAIHKWSIDGEAFRSMCESPTEVTAKWLRENFNVFLGIIDRKALEAAVPLMGNYPLGANQGDNSNTDPYPVNLVDSNNNFQPMALALLTEQFDAMGKFGIDPMIVGNGYLGLVEKMRAYSGINDNGVNTNYRGGMENTFIDDLIDKTIPHQDGPRMLTWVPGSLQLITWNEFTDNYAQYQEIFRGGSFPAEMRSYEYIWDTVDLLPDRPGRLVADFLYSYDKCNDKHTWALVLNFAVVSLPEDAFAECQDYNFNLNFVQACGTLDCNATNNQIFND